MTIQEARDIPLEIVLEDMGIYPAHRHGNDIFYYARGGDKKTPSFKINTKINKWYDHGVGVGGNTIDAVIFLKGGDFYDALKYLSKFSNNYHSYEHKVSYNFHRDKSEKKTEKTYEIIDVKNIYSYSLKDYIEDRKIDRDIADKYLKEIVYKMKTAGDKNLYTLGFKNDSGGWETRNENYKLNLGGKNITTLNNDDKNSRLKIFEGAWDFLSYLTMCPEGANSNDFIILNSVAMVHKLDDIEKEKYKYIDCYFDNDEAGKRTFKDVKEKFPDSIVNDYSYTYENYKDLNEWLQDNIEEEKVNVNKKRRL